MHRHDERHRHRALRAVGGKRQGNADEHGVAVGGRYAGDHPGARIAAEEAADQKIAEHPVHAEDREERQPEQPGRGAGKIGGGERAEDEERDGDGEDEAGERLAGILGEKADPGDAVADADQPEDRQNDVDDLFHLRMRAT